MVRPGCRVRAENRVSDSPSLPMIQASYKVADISLAAFGRKELEIAEVEMPYVGILFARENR